MKYIKVINNFQNSNPNYFEKLFFSFLPKSNHSPIIFNKICYWYLEFEETEIKREIAFNEDDSIIYKSPTNQNYGIWCDSPVSLFDIKSYEEIDLDIFEHHWDR